MRPKWLVDLIGVDYFGTVVSASLAERATDEDLVRLLRISADSRDSSSADASR